MSSTATRTTTYTKADVRKVVENFAADYAMIADFTGLKTRETVQKDVSDLTKFAEDGYLTRVTLYLMDKDGNPLRVATYDVSDNAVGWQSGMPGNNVWSAPEGAYLQIMATLTNEWFDKSDEGKGQYLSGRGFYYSWGKSDKSISLLGLSQSSGQKYASNGYGWSRTNYSK
jgi:hypothetical protein